MRGGARRAAPEAYFEYVEGVVEGANEADGPLSAARTVDTRSGECVGWCAMPRRDEIAERMAEAVVKRLVFKKAIDVKDEAAARAAVRHVVIGNITAEEQLDADAKKLLLDHAKAIKDSAADYRQLLGKVKEKLARERGFII